MQEADARAALQGAAEALRDAARDHKLREGQHRKQARALMQRQAELRAQAEALGIHLESTDTEVS